MKKGLLLASLFFLLTILAILSRIAPLYEPIPARDQGVYLYIGQQIMDGGIPYRDVWDHKGPLVYYINALGLWMTNSVWGVWILEIIFLFLAAVLGFLALQMVFDPVISFSSTILWLAALPQVLDHGNTVEEYSLLFQFATIYFYLRSEKSAKVHWNEIIVGIMAAMAFSLRPNNIGVHVAIGLVLLTIAFFSPTERIHTFKRIFAVASGGGIVFGIIGIYFAVNKSLGYLLDQVFIFNYYYSKTDTISWQAITKGYTVMPFLVVLGMAGLIGLIAYLYGYWKQDQKESDLIRIRFFLFTLIVVPVQLYLSLLSGRKYLHYYIAWLPVLAILTAFLIFWIQQLSGKIITDIRLKRILNSLIAGGLILVFGIHPVFVRMPSLLNLFKTIQQNKSLPIPDYSAVEQNVYIKYILDHTKPGDSVLIWGNASVYNFLTERKSPSRFVYTYAFGVPGYVSQELIDELTLDITQKKPMIIDATAKDNTMEGISSDLWKDLPVTQGLIRFIESNYVHIDTIGPNRFRIWVYKGD